MDARDVDALSLLSSRFQMGNTDMEGPKKGSISPCWDRGRRVSPERAAVLNWAVFKLLVIERFVCWYKLLRVKLLARDSMG